MTVTRLISGVDTRVTITGPLRQPELRLSSTPPLDSSDILSLIVFNTPPNQLSAAQQQELAVRAGTLAAGFLATPIISALQNEIGLDVLEVDPSGDLISAGPKVTVGEEIAPGLVARFSRQFGLRAVRRSDVRILPIAHLAAASDLLRRAIPRSALAVPAHRTRWHRPAVVFQFLRRPRPHGAVTKHDIRRRRLVLLYGHESTTFRRGSDRRVHRGCRARAARRHAARDAAQPDA